MINYKKRLALMCIMGCVSMTSILSGCGKEQAVENSQVENSVSTGDTSKETTEQDSYNADEQNADSTGGKVKGAVAKEEIVMEEATKEEAAKEEVKAPELTEEEKKQYRAEFENPQTLYLDTNFPSADISFGGNNINVRNIDDLDMSVPTYILHVNPMADDALMQDYIQSVLMLDEKLGANPEYMNYIAESRAKYSFSVNCMGEELFRVPIDGSHTEAEITKRMKETVGEQKEKLQKGMEEFNTFMETYDGLQVDEEGNYYMIFDTKSYTKSMDQVAEVLDILIEKSPISRELAGEYMDSFLTYGNPVGSFTLYADSYGNEMNWNVQFTDEPTFVNHKLMSQLVNLDQYYTTRDDIKIGFLQLNYSENDCMWCTLDIRNNQVVLKDVIDYSYEFYSDMYNQFVNLGVKPWAPLEIMGSFENQENEKVTYIIGSEIPMEKKLSKEEFTKYFRDGIEEFDPGELKFDYEDFD